MANNRHAYLIMAHNEWELLNTMLSLIDDPRLICINRSSPNCILLPSDMT